MNMNIPNMGMETDIPTDAKIDISMDFGETLRLDGYNSVFRGGGGGGRV
jgi:hypothetical protein